MAVHPGDIYFDRSYGRRHPFVVVSREELNRGRYVVAIPLTSARLSERWDLPNCVRLQSGEAGLRKDCVAQCEHVTTILIEDLDVVDGYVGSLGEAKLDMLVKAIGDV